MVRNNLNDLDPDLNVINNIKIDNSCQKFNSSRFNDKFSTKKPNLNVVCFNVRSFNKNGDEFLAYIDELKLKFDVIILTETWASVGTLPLISIPGYKAFHSIRTDCQAGGVGVFIRDIYSCHERLCINNNIIEAVAIDVNLSYNESVTVIGLYRPPNGSVSTFNSNLENFFDSLSLNSKNFIVGGDLNICLFKKEIDINTMSFASLMSSYSLIPHITLATREHRYTKSLIDNIWSNIVTVAHSGVLDVDITDHYPVFAIFENLLCNENDIIRVSFRDFSVKNSISFKDDLKNVDWFENCIDVNVMTSSFLEKFYQIFNRNFPIKTKTIGLKRLKKPWLSKAIMKSIKEKHRLYKLFKQNLCDSDYFSNYRNLLTTLIRQSKKNHYSRKFSKAFDDIKETWKLINNTIGSKRMKKTEFILKDNGDTIDKTDVANFFNKYFTSIAQKMQDSVQQDIGDPLSFISKSVDHSIFLLPCSPYEVRSVINKLNNSGSGLHNPSSKTYKLVSDIIDEPISLIFNNILHSGIYPDKLKIACVTPIFKNDDSYNVKNYRPISCLPVLNMVLEKLFYSRFIDFINRNDILIDEQCGFRKGRSTNMALIELLHNIYQSFNNTEYFGAIFLDLRKAFDCVSHSILLNKLSIYGFRGKAHSILSSYLANRQQFVSANGNISEYLPVVHGVPHGSILGPLLFLLYINGLPNCLKCSS